MKTGNINHIMEGFRSGRQPAFAQIFKLLYPSLCHLAFRITADQFAAQDLVEESFVKIWERRADFHHINVLKSFLYTTVRNASINWVKANRKEDAHKLQYGRQLQPEQSGLEDIIAADTFRELHTALDRLPAQSRQIINMLFIEGKKTSEVAQALQLSLAHVSTQKKRGLLLLRKFMAPSISVFFVFLFFQ